MKTAKKRKRLILDSDDEGDDRPAPAIHNSKKSPADRKISKKKRAFDSDDDEIGDVGDEEPGVSINDIKKDAKKKAKKLALTGVADSGQKPAKVAKQKTPPSAASNNIMNYFKPRDTSKTPPGGVSKEPKENGSKKLDDDGYTYTNVISKKSISSPKKSEIRDEKFEKIEKEKSLTETSQETKRKPILDGKKKDEIEKSVSDFKIETEKVIFDNKIPKVKSEKNNIRTEALLEATKLSKMKDVKHESPKKKKSIDVKMKSPKKTVAEKEKPEPVLPRLVEVKRESELWVDKYKPTNVKQIIGQQGDRSALKKLIRWLSTWHQNLDKKPAFGKWGSDDGSGFRAALLSGPPGIGKTTSAQLVCRELGFDYLELNASDSRNKRSLQENVSELLKNTKLTDFFKANNDASKNGETKDQKLTARHCLIMDEVDGIAGNEDRGGVAELIQLIKGSKIPIICICNDRNDSKMRSLVNYCFDLRFAKPKLDQIKATLMSIAFKEQLKISGDVLNDLIVSSNYDIRQCIHNLYMVAHNQPKVGKMITANEKPIKDVRLSPFEAIKKVFCTGKDYALMSFIDKSDLFFCDYSIMPLFVYENYVSINLGSKQPSVAKQLKRLYRAIDSISLGDMVEKEIRSNQAWSLLPLQAAFSTVMPGSYMRSSDGLGFPQFPQFMGKLSTTNKNHRIVDQLVSHMKLAISGSKQSLILDYLQPIRDLIVDSLVHKDKAGVSTVMDSLENYALTKEDMDSILEFCIWADETDPMKSVDSKTKAALTRAYNSKDFRLPYSLDSDIKVVGKKGANKKGKKNGFVSVDHDDEAENDLSQGEEDGDLLYLY